MAGHARAAAVVIAMIDMTLDELICCPQDIFELWAILDDGFEPWYWGA